MKNKYLTCIIVAMVFTLPFALPAFAGDSMDTYPAYGVNAPSPLADTSDFVLSGTTLTSYTGTDEEVVIPEGVTRINRDAFKGNTTMKRVILPTSCDYIQYAVFSTCTSLEEAVLNCKTITFGNVAIFGTQEVTVYGYP